MSLKSFCVFGHLHYKRRRDWNPVDCLKRATDSHRIKERKVSQRKEKHGQERRRAETMFDLVIQDGRGVKITERWMEGGNIDMKHIR